MKKLLFTTSIFLALSNLQAEASIILLEDNFNSENGGSAESLNHTSFSNWNVTRGSVDIIGKGYNATDFFPDNGLYVDMDGTSLSAGKLESKSEFDFNTGDSITLMFDILGENPDPANTNNNIMTVSLGTLFSEDFSKNDIGTIRRRINVTSDIKTSLIFDHNGGDDVGLILDNVKLQNTSIPEPTTTLGLVVLGTLGVGSTLKRKLDNTKK